MKTFIASIALLLLTSCTALDIQGARISGGFSNFKATAESTIDDFTVKDSANGDTSDVRVELVNKMSPRTSVGLFGEIGSGSVQDVDLSSAGGGMAVRHALTDWSITPFIEGRAGYSRVTVDDIILGSDDVDMAKVGAGLGLEWQVCSSFSVFGQANYDASFGDGLTLSGTSFFFGAGVTF